MIDFSFLDRTLCFYGSDGHILHIFLEAQNDDKAKNSTLKNMMQFCWWREGFKIPDLTENLTIKGLIVPDDNDDDDDNEDDSLEWSQGSHNQLDLSKTILKFYPSCFHHLARLGSHSNIFRCGSISSQSLKKIQQSRFKPICIMLRLGLILDLNYNSL